MIRIEIITGFGLLCLLLGGCGLHDSPKIYGGSTEMTPQGQLARIDLRNEGEVVLAMIYPVPILMTDIEFLHSGHKGNDVRSHREAYIIRFPGRDPDTLPVTWDFYTRAQKLVFNGISFNLPINQVGVITFDDDCNPMFELRENTPEVIAELRAAIGAVDDADTIPAKRLVIPE